MNSCEFSRRLQSLTAADAVIAESERVTVIVPVYIVTAGGGNRSLYRPFWGSVWGAGHQALAVLSLLKLERSVRYVVDSAPFKQGRYTLGSHLPIVSPEALRTDPVEAVLVMAASYSDEVARTLRTRFGTALPFAVVRDSGLEEGGCGCPEAGGAGDRTWHRKTI